MEVKLNLCLFAIFCCIFIKTAVSDSDVENKEKATNITIECTLLDNHDLLIQESIKRGSFLYKLQIYGPIISFTDIPNDDAFCPGHIVVIEIMATDKIIINNDYNSLGEDLTFIVAAPILEVVDKRRIDLRGHDGSMHERPTAYNGNRDGNRNGDNGLAGYPGGPGGHFHAIASEVINFDKLTVRVQGGNGGAGQNGGNGVSGVSGTVFDLSKDKIKHNGDVEDFEVILRRNIHSPKDESYLGNGIQEVVLGKQGTNGGNGGDGGIGGQGGLPGVYAFLNLQIDACNVSTIFKKISKGRNGRDGKGGRGGVAGYSGSDIVVDLYFSEGNDVVIRNTEYHEQAELLDGKNGLNGQSSEGEKNPHEHPHWQNFLYSVDRFHDFLKTNINMSLNITKVHQVIPLINKIINNLRCLMSFIE